MPLSDSIYSARLQRLRAYLARDPDNWNLRADLFDAALAAGDRTLAREQLDAAERLRPGDPAWRHRGATLLLAEHEYQEAEALLATLIAEGNDHPQVRHNLGFARFGQGKWKEAAETVEGLLDLPADAGADAALVLWLRCEHHLDRLDEALVRFQTLATMRPLAPETWGVASLIAVDLENLADGKAWSDRALEGAPGQLEALIARGTLRLGELDAAGAGQAFEKALQQNSTDGRSWSGLAFALMLAGNFPAADEAFRKAVVTMPGHVGTWNGLGWCNALMKRPVEAQRAFAQAVEVERNNAEAHGGLAVALAQVGQEQDARREIEVALRLDRASLSARYAEALLSGEAQDPAAFQRLARRILAKHPIRPGCASGPTIGDLIFGGGAKDPG